MTPLLLFLSLSISSPKMKTARWRQEGRFGGGQRRLADTKADAEDLQIGEGVEVPRVGSSYSQTTEAKNML